MRVRMMLSGLLLISGVAVAQSAPVKMGLWETTASMQTPMGKRTIVTQSCFTQETYEKALASVQAPPQECSFHNEKSADGFNISGTCSMQQGMTMEMRGKVTIVDAGHTNTTVHTTMNMQGQSMESDMESTSSFVKADCGAVQPGKSVVVSK
ncbi:MAG TPA: DUF3617 family protein [Granulicella sp.]